MKFLNILITGTLLITFFCLSVPAHAQKSDMGNWFMYFGNQKINSKWNLWTEVQYRNYNFAGDLEQLLLRTGLGYNLTENNNNLLLGYGFIYSEPYIAGTENKMNTSEHRIYQQFVTRHSIGRVAVQHRYRTEERFLQNNVFRMRFRYFTSLNIPLNKKLIEKNTLYLSAYNEIFVNKKSPVFDRDRVYVGFGYSIGKNMRLETGIMSQLFEIRHRPQWQIMMFNNIPFKKPD